MCRFIVIVAMVPALLLAACTTTPSVPEANQQVCAALKTYYGSVIALKEIGPTSTINDVKDAQKAVDTAYEGVAGAMTTYQEAKIDAVKAAQENLKQSVDQVSGSTTLAEAKTSIMTSVTALADAIKGLNDAAKCPVLPATTP